jgi:serine/threonine-protein kinase
MGVVWEARPTDGGQAVALKLIAPDFARHPIAIARFLREARVLSLLSSPHVVKILDHGMDAARGPFIIMELLEGEDLAARIARRGPLPHNEVLDIFSQVAAALTEAHDAGLIHRDLKPANIFLAQEADHHECAKVLDFGTAKADTPLMLDGGRTAPGVVVGTLSRMSPEQLKGERVDRTSDVWGVALCVFEALTGVKVVDPDLPFGQLVHQICHGSLPSPSHFNPNLSRAIDAWFEKSTARLPTNRYAAVQEQMEALEACTRVSGVVRKRDDTGTSRPASEMPTGVNTLSPPRFMSFPPLAARCIPESVRIIDTHEEGSGLRHTLVPGGRPVRARVPAHDDENMRQSSAETIVPPPVMGEANGPLARTG